MSSKTLRQIAELSTVSIPQLEERWRRLFDTAPPAHQKRFLIKHLAYRIQELTQLAEQRRNEIGSFAHRKTQCETEMAEARRRIVDIEHERETTQVRATDLSAQRQALDADVASREEELRGLRRRLEELQQKRGAIEIELAQKTMSTQNLRERIQQKYQINLDDVRSECITITYADGGPPKVETLTPDEMASAGVSTDWLAVAQQVTALQQRIDEMGPVNLVAIEEYEETEQQLKNKDQE